jgi:3-oxoacyl-[acyl-carrier protein] reductase
MPFTIDLTGKTAIVTGSTRGIGRAIAQALVQAGAKVAVCGREQAKAEAVARELGGETMGVALDVGSAESIEAAVAAVTKAWGGVDILVNNAGITKDNLLIRLDDEQWDAVLDANLKGAFRTVKACLKGMMKKRAGRIINITSVVGLMGNKGQANYAASKAGLVGFTKSVAKEYASRGITANCVAPGYIETDMTAALPDEARAALFQFIPLERLGRPEDIAGAVLYLSSDLASYITGQVLVVDGGMVM